MKPDFDRKLRYAVWEKLETELKKQCSHTLYKTLEQQLESPLIRRLYFDLELRCTQEFYARFSNEGFKDYSERLK